MRHLFLFEDEKDLDVDLVTESDLTVIRGLRKDLSSQAYKVPELKQAGVYLLLSANMIYVGQSSQSVLSRLRSHDSEKDWWDTYIVITDTHGEMEKTSTEYIEAYFIHTFQQIGLTLDNDTVGNSSKISKFTMMKSKSIFDRALNIILNVLNIDIFREHEKANVDETSSHSKLRMVLSDGAEFEASSARKLLHSILSHYSTDINKYSILITESTSSPDVNSIITTMKFDSDKNKYWALSGDLYMFSNLTKTKALEQIEYFLEIFGLTIVRDSRI